MPRFVTSIGIIKEGDQLVEDRVLLCHQSKIARSGSHQLVEEQVVLSGLVHQVPCHCEDLRGEDLAGNERQPEASVEVVVEVWLDDQKVYYLQHTLHRQELLDVYIATAQLIDEVRIGDDLFQSGRLHPRFAHVLAEERNLFIFVGVRVANSHSLDQKLSENCHLLFALRHRTFFFVH